MPNPTTRSPVVTNIPNSSDQTPAPAQARNSTNDPPKVFETSSTRETVFKSSFFSRVARGIDCSALAIKLRLANCTRTTSRAARRRATPLDKRGRTTTQRRRR